MAVDKLVDSTQLDADLTSVANAIRAKGGTSAQMAFPNGFVSAVQAIPTGGGPTGTKQISITQNGTTTEDVAAYANAEITVNVQGGGGVGVSGTFTPASDIQSVTLSDCIGKSNILIFPMFDLVSGSISQRTHWGCVIIGGRSIFQCATNTAGSSYAANIPLDAGTGQISNGDTFDSTTGTVTIRISGTTNYGGYFAASKQYGYIAW